MPRVARRMSGSKIYHVMLRGLNRQTIFEDDEDYRFFLSVLDTCRESSDTRILAYCLMSNHVHIVVHSSDLSSFMRKAASKYAYWYNWKYDRIGSLFQDRFKSEAVESDAYLLTVIRYIHQNPIKAGIATSSDTYKCSSYNEYTRPDYRGITDTKYVLDILPLSQFIHFHEEIEDGSMMDISEKHRLNDKVAKGIILELSGCSNPSEFQAMGPEKRNKVLFALKSKGLTVRQIERLTGINRGVVLKA